MKRQLIGRLHLEVSFHKHYRYTGLICHLFSYIYPSDNLHMKPTDERKPTYEKTTHRPFTLGGLFSYTGLFLLVGRICRYHT